MSVGVPLSKPASRARDITSMKIFFEYVQQALDDIRWSFDQAGFDDLLALKKDSPPGRDGILDGVYKYAGGLGSKFTFRAYQAALKRSSILDCFAEVGPSLSPRLLILKTLEGLFDHLMHFAR